MYKSRWYIGTLMGALLLSVICSIVTVPATASPPQLIRDLEGYILIVDLMDPGTSFRVVIARDKGGSARETVGSMAQRYKAIAGINTDYFGGSHGAEGMTYIEGTSINHDPYRSSLAISPSNQVDIGKGMRGDPSLNFNVTGGGPQFIRNGQAYWERTPTTALCQSNDPFGMINGECFPGTKARWDGGGAEYTAVGITQDGSKLILLVTIRGVKPLHAAELLIKYGAWTGMKFDSGGSTQLYYNGDVLKAGERPVAAGLLVFYKANVSTSPPSTNQGFAGPQPKIFIDRSDTSSSHLQGSGETFHFTGRGFSGFNATQRVVGPNTNINQRIQVFPSGTIGWDFTPECKDNPGSYDIWVIDDLNGESNHVIELIEAGPECGVQKPTPGGGTPPVATIVAHMTISSQQGSIHEGETLRLSLALGQQTLQVTLDASGSNNPRGETLVYRWYMDGNRIGAGTDSSVVAEVGLGQHEFLVKVTDCCSESDARATVIVTTQQAPVTPPVEPTTKESCQANNLLTFCRTTPSSVQAGAKFTVNSTVTARVGLNIVGIVDQLPSGFTLVSGSLNSGLPTPLGAGQSKTITYIVRAGSASGTISGIANGLPSGGGSSQRISLDSLITVTGGGAALGLNNSLEVSGLTFRPIGVHSTHFVLAITGQAIASTWLQVFNLQGQAVYDSGFQNGSSLSWSALDSFGRPLANGVYFYLVTVRGYDGKVIRSEVRKVGVMR